jgi:hypothetical protein
MVVITMTTTSKTRESMAIMLLTCTVEDWSTIMALQRREEEEGTPNPPLPPRRGGGGAHKDPHQESHRLLEFLEA